MQTKSVSSVYEIGERSPILSRSHHLAADSLRQHQATNVCDSNTTMLPKSDRLKFGDVGISYCSCRWNHTQMTVIENIQIYAATISVFLSLFAITISVYTAKRAHRTSIKPVLIFSNDIELLGGNTSWYVKNVGNGPAVNIILVSGPNCQEWITDYIVIIPALATGERHHLDWIPAKGALVATYSDAFNRVYTTVCEKNRNRIYENNLYPKFVPTKSLYQLRTKFDSADLNNRMKVVKNESHRDSDE